MASRFMCYTVGVLATLAMYLGTAYSGTAAAATDDDSNKATLMLNFENQPAGQLKVTGPTVSVDDSGRGTLLLTGPSTFVGDPPTGTFTPDPQLGQATSGGRPWGPEQATGAPNTPRAGDIQTAWASRSQDDQEEWLLLEYARPVQPIAVLVYETYKPGAVREVSAFTPDGRDEGLWQGNDPTDRSADKGISVIPVKPGFATQKIRLRIASRSVPGWNEIDAVGLLDATGKTHWATGATASTTYAEVIAENTNQVRSQPDAADQRIRRLENEVRQLRSAVDRLRRAVEESRQNRDRQMQ